MPDTQPTNTSPVPKKKQKPVTFTFPEAMQVVIDGGRVTRLDWNTNAEYGLLKDGWLTIHRGEFHRWLVNDGDMVATDWIKLPDVN